MKLLRERIPDGHVWWHIADPAWNDPLDPGFARQHGGRWNPPDSFPVLYLNEDLSTARMNLHAFVAQWPYGPEDLRDDPGPSLVGCALPRRQTVCDAHSRAGIDAAGLPRTYPFLADGTTVPHAPCQAIGTAAKAGLRGIHTRSAQTSGGSGLELAWFPASSRSIARRIRSLTFSMWFRGQAPTAGQ